MIGASIAIVGGLALLAVGAEGLVRGSTAIALRLGVTPLVIGLTIVAFGTSTPELFVSVEAAVRGNTALALGNVVGSNISNIALILGLSALARPMRVRSALILREVPLMIAVTLLLCLLMEDGALSRFEGVLLVCGSIAYTWFAYRASRRDRSAVVREEFEDALASAPHAPWIDVVLVVAGLAALTLGARLLVAGATSVAMAFGVSQMVIGLTVVAIGTSLPELATSVAAALKNEADVAFGNVIGSNVLNILCVLGVAVIIRPVDTAGLRGMDIVALVVTAVAILPIMYRGSVLNRWEGALLVGGYGAYLYSLS